MRFTKFLIESKQAEKILHEKHDLVLQKVLDAVDNGHVDYSDERILFDIGEISDTPQLRGLKMVIRSGGENNIRLAKAKDSNYAIVIDTTEQLPNRQDIDTFLARKEVYSGFKRAYERYAKKYHDKNKVYEPNETQQQVNANSREAFETNYNDLIKAIGSHHQKYSQAVAEIDKELGSIANVGRKQALELAKNKLRDEYLGKDDKEFLSKVLNLPEAGFHKHLDKTWKSKLEGRLGSYYKSTYGR